MERINAPSSADPMDAYRSVILRSGKSAPESKDIKETVAEAGHETRSVNQVVKLVNIHLSEKVKRLNEIKAASKRFDDELNMFTNPAQQEQENTINESHKPQESISEPHSNESQAVLDDLSALINKYGFEKLSKALDEILTKNKE